MDRVKGNAAPSDTLVLFGIIGGLAQKKSFRHFMRWRDGALSTCR